MDEPRHRQCRRAYDAGIHNITAKLLVCNQRIFQDAQNLLPRALHLVRRRIFPQRHRRRYSHEGDDGLRVKRIAERIHRQQSAEDSGHCLGEISDHRDASLVSQVQIFASVVHRRVVEKRRIRPVNHRLPDAQQDFRHEEGRERTRQRITQVSPEKEHAPGHDTPFAPPDIRQIARRNLERDRRDGIHALQNEYVLQSQSVFFVKKDDDGHHEGEPLR